MFLSLALYHNNPLANSEPPKAEIVPRVFSARGALAAKRSAKARKQSLGGKPPRLLFFSSAHERPHKR
jgi:hypothetical protein